MKVFLQTVTQKRRVLLYLMTAVVLILMFTVTLLLLLPQKKQPVPDVVRLHIRADNDSDAAQAAKIVVRNVLLSYLSPLCAEAEDKEAVLHVLRREADMLRHLSVAALHGIGSHEPVSVSVEKSFFPVRLYGALPYNSSDAVFFPPGEYDTLSVSIGDGAGKNWWCLLYPSLCFVDASYDVVPEESKERLTLLLDTEEEFPVVFRFKLYEKLLSLLKKLGWYKE